MVDLANSTLLHLLPFLSAATDAHLQEFQDVVQQVDLPAGAVICREGNACSTLPIVITGSARVMKLGENGREITLYRIFPGESCVLTATCILSQDAFPAEALAEGELKALLVPAPELKLWTERYDFWRSFIFGMMARRFGDVVQVIDEVVFQRLDYRLVQLLLSLGGEQGSISRTHQQLAADLGSAREVISRLLKDLEQRGFLDSRRGQITILDREALLQLSRKT